MVKNKILRIICCFISCALKQGLSFGISHDVTENSANAKYMASLIDGEAVSRPYAVWQWCAGQSLFPQEGIVPVLKRR